MGISWAFLKVSPWYRRPKPCLLSKIPISPPEIIRSLARENSFGIWGDLGAEFTKSCENCLKNAEIRSFDSAV